MHFCYTQYVCMYIVQYMPFKGKERPANSYCMPRKNSELCQSVWSLTPRCVIKIQISEMSFGDSMLRQSARSQTLRSFSQRGVRLCAALVSMESDSVQLQSAWSQTLCSFSQHGSDSAQLQRGVRLCAALVSMELDSALTYICIMHYFLNHFSLVQF